MLHITIQCEYHRFFSCTAVNESKKQVIIYSTMWYVCWMSKFSDQCSHNLKFVKKKSGGNIICLIFELWMKKKERNNNNKQM